MRFKKFMLVCAGVLSALAFISEVKSEEPVVVEGKILVRYESSLSAQEIETIEKEFGLQRLNYMSAINTGYYRISGSEDQIDLIERLRKKTGVVLVEEDLLRTQSAAIPNDPLYGQQWYLNSATATHINFQSAIQAFSGTTTIDVAVIDSGILLNHPEFVGKINNTWAYDYVENDTTPQDENGHGTMVASLIGATHGNGSGMAGVCPNVRFLPLRVFDNAGRFATTTSGVLVSALQRAYDANVRIVNLSLGGGGYSAAELSMFEALNTKGILAVIAAGNGDAYGRGINNDSSPTYPASYSAPNIISVMATDSTGNPASFSNYGSANVDIAAPGVGVLAANVRRSTAYNDNFSTGSCDWAPWTETGSSPWTRNYRSFNGSFATYNNAGIYKYFNFTGKQGLRAELSGLFILGFGDIVVLEVWNGTSWGFIDVIAWPGDIALNKSLDISAFDGAIGYARINLYCDIWAYGASFARYAEIDTIKITEVAVNSVSNPEYLNVDGTSFSSPIVAGTAALLLSQNPTLQVSDLKAAILSTATTRSSLSGKSVTGGIVNVSAALAAAQPKQSQTISFSALTTKTYGDADFAINAVASSGLSVSYSSSDDSVAAISGNTVSIVGAGTATITASQGGNSTYSAAANVQQTLTVNKKSLVIVADNKTKEIGQSDPILTYTSFGLLSGSSITGAPSRSTGESVGTYNINQGTITAGNNYAISFTQGSFVITAVAPQLAIITTTPPPSLIYDAANKPFGVSVTPPASVQGEYIQLASIGNPSSGYGLTYNLSPSGFLTTAFSGIDGIFRASQASTKISSTGLTYSFPSSLVSSTAGGEGGRNPWQNTTDATGGPTSQINSYFAPLGVTWSSSSLYAVPSCGITFDLSKIKPSNKIITKFTTYYGMHSGNSAGDAAYAILLDGVLVSSGRNYTSANPFSNLIEVDIAPNNRFLTLVACDNGDDYNWDHSVFVDPKVYAKVGELSANCIYTGINGTIYGPSSVAPKDVGYYRLEVSSNDPNYIGTKTQEFSITPKSATVTAAAKTKVYGSADPTLTYASSGLIGSDSLSGVLTRTAGENVGSYDILVGTLSAGANYALSYTGASLGITAATLSSSVINITAPSSLVYDGTGKGHTASASGVSGFSYTYTGVSPTVYAASPTAPITPGTYLVTASSTDANYTGNKTANFTITPKLVTITAADKTKVYGSADPTFTYTSSGLIGSDSLNGALTRTAGENVGSYNILVGTLSAGANYTLSYTGASLGITAATLSSSAINVTGPSSLVYDGTGKGHTASASGVSGFTYTYAGVSPTVYPSSTTAPKDVGAYTVTASSTDINQSGSKAVNFTITPKLVTITAANKTRVYGSADPALTYTSSGLVGSDSLSGALTRTAGENVGSYAIQIGTLSAGPNYTVSFTGDSMEITPKEVGVVASPKSKSYKSGDPVLTFTSSGLLGSDSIRGELTRVSGENVGFYEIRIGTLSAGDNYSLKYTAASLEITPQPLAVTAVAKTKVYGSVDPTLTYTSSGLIGSDSLSGALTRTAGENVGSYDILVGTLSAGANYTLSYTGASLGITAASLSSSAINISGPSSLVYDGTGKVHTASAGGVSGFSYTYTGVSPTVYTSSATAPKDVGTYTVTASSTDLNNSGSKVLEFLITPKPATVTAVAKTKVYGSADPALTYTSSGLVGSDSLSGELTRTAGESVGSYDILLGTLSAGANYTLSYAGASLGITASTLSSSAINISGPSSLVYDGTGKGHTASANGISGFSYSYVGVSPTVYPSSATAPTDAGTYTVTASSTDINQSGSKAVNFTITPKLVTITAADKTKVYGSTDPVLTYTSSGLVGSDSLSGALTRAAGESVGSYDILLGTLSAGPNYYFYTDNQKTSESVNMQMVEVGDINNEAASSSGAGSVSYKYLIGKYEVTLGQYAVFLNSVAKSDPNGLYKPSMSTSPATPSFNAAFNKTVTASSTYEDSLSFHPSNVVNAEPNDFWIAKGSNEPGYSMPAWLVIDLAGQYSIQNIIIWNTTNRWFRDRGAKDFFIQVSDDGTNYARTIIRGTLSWDQYGQTFTTDTPVSARYVKVVFTSAYGQYNCPGILAISVTTVATSEKTYGIIRSGQSGAYTYSVVGSGNLPITGLSSFDVYRFCNWLHNGSRSDSSTETGAYTLTGASSSIVSANQNALFRLPTYNEWYKAAFYKGGSQSAGYWNYPTKSDALPTAVRPASGVNQANYGWTALETVGAYTGSSGPYGTYDMGGNAWELVEWRMTLGGGGSATSTTEGFSSAFLGGGYGSIGAALLRDAFLLDTASTLDVGIRLVSPAPDVLGGKLAITPKSLSIAGITIPSKKYDGTRAATVSGGELVGVVLGDDVILSGAPTGLFDSPNPGSGIGVVVAGYELSGSSAGNYTLLQPSGLSGSITTTIQSWASAYGLTGQAALAESDPDNDGKNNAAEYAFGGNPATADQQVVSASPVLGGIKFVWLERKVQGQVTYNPKTSTDLALSYSSWATVNSAESNPQPAGISTDYKQMEVVLPTSAGKGFLKIEANVQ